MRKKLFAAFAVPLLIMMFLVFTRYTYGDSKGLSIEQLANPSCEEIKLEIAQKVAEDLGPDYDFDPKSITGLSVYFGNFSESEENDAIVVIQTVPKEALIVVYSLVDDEYLFSGMIDRLSNVEGVNFVGLPNIANDMIIISEMSDQRIGSFEKGSFLRGYMCVDGDFIHMMDIRTGVESYWNKSWNYAVHDENIPAESGWDRIKEISDIKWNGDDFVLILSRDQSLSSSVDKESMHIPDEDSFVTSQSRKLVSRYYWSDKWKRLILKEMIETETGETVAVIEDFNESPYTLLDGNYEKFMILRKDGTTEIVGKNQLEEK